MGVDHNMSEMVSKQMSETGNRSHGTHPHRVELPLDGLEQYATSLAKSVTRGLDRETAAYDLTPTEFAAVRLFLTDLEWTATELTQMLSVDASSMSRAVSRLVDRGVLSRRRPREDRRMVYLKLTEEGVALGFELQERVHSYEERLTHGISPEDLEVFLGTIRRIVANHAALEDTSSDLAGQPGEVAADGGPSTELECRFIDYKGALRC